MEFSVLYALQELHGRVLDQVMVFVTHLGDKGWFWILLSLFVLLAVKDRKCGVTMLLALLINVVLVNLLLKNIVMRPRPCWIDPDIVLLVKRPSDYSFPSGHASASFAAALTLLRYYRKAGLTALCLAALISFSRLYLFVHFPTDVAAGAALGCCAFLAAGALVDRYGGRFGL